MSAPTICFEMLMWKLPGRRQATELFEKVEDVDPTKDFEGVTLELHGYNSSATEPGDGAVLDLILSVDGEEREKSEDRPYGGRHVTEVAAKLTRSMALAVRDQLNVFLELE